jgi:hypothetical protein
MPQCPVAEVREQHVGREQIRLHRIGELLSQPGGLTRGTGPEQKEMPRRRPQKSPDRRH